MKCDLLDYSFTRGWYCKETYKSLDKSTVNSKCDNRLSYRDCPIYRRSGYYITSAICEVLGMDPECDTRTTIREFMDDYMFDFSREEETFPIMEDYNEVGPVIADCLFDDKDKYSKAAFAYFAYLKPVVKCIKSENYDAAIGIYEAMTYEFMDHYGITDITLKGDYSHLENSGVQRTRIPNSKLSTN